MIWTNYFAKLTVEFKFFDFNILVVKTKCIPFFVFYTYLCLLLFSTKEATYKKLVKDYSISNCIEII